MARTVIDIDDEALEAAARLLGTKTKKDTVNAALNAIIDRKRRAVALERLRQLADEGAVDFEMLEKRKPKKRKPKKRDSGKSAA